MPLDQGELPVLKVSDTFGYQVARLGTDKNLNILLPAGIGDSLWIMGKLKQAHDERGNVKFWLPHGEQQRAGDYLRMIGVNHGYMPGLTTDYVWSREGSPVLPSRGCVSVQANHHLESGFRIEEWYPEIELAYPKMKIEAVDDFGAGFALLFPGSRHYMQQNLTVAQWVAIARNLKEQYGAVRMIGAGNDVEFTEQIIEGFGGEGHLLNRPFDDVAAAFTSPRCKLFIGVASGPLIAATAAGVKTAMAYPRHLAKMPGSWEQPGADTKWCFVNELPTRLEGMVYGS